jgi:hypothetical protein
MKQLSKLLYTTIILNTKQDRPKSSISEVRHKPTHDSECLNQAVGKAINDQNFLNTSINLLGNLNFPTFKNNIIDHIKKATKDPDIISLFESLDGYTHFRDQNHVQKALEVNDPKRKLENQTTDQTQIDPSSTGPTIDNKHSPNVISEERKGFRKITPTSSN